MNNSIVSRGVGARVATIILALASVVACGGKVTRDSSVGGSGGAGGSQSRGSSATGGSANGGSTTSAGNKCSSPGCPTLVPSDGVACDPCQEQIEKTCVYPMPDAALVAIASCDGAKWHVQQRYAPCGENPLDCSPGEICVDSGEHTDKPPLCFPNPCPPGEPLSCNCAGSLCTVGYCATTTPDAVYCECSGC